MLYEVVVLIIQLKVFYVLGLGVHGGVCPSSLVKLGGLESLCRSICESVKSCGSVLLAKFQSQCF